ncbi:hypothetical protein IT568_08225 [bacterium]|nr:hypothetical protein [bacterium]
MKKLFLLLVSISLLFVSCGLDPNEQENRKDSKEYQYKLPKTVKPHLNGETSDDGKDETVEYLPAG